MRGPGWGSGAAAVVAVAATVACLSALWSPAARASDVGATAPVRDLVVIAVPGLRWSDVARLPALQAFVATAAIGNLSVRTEPTTTRCAGGQLAFGAGARTPEASTQCLVSPGAYTAARRRVVADGDARPGALGDALHAAGWRTITIGDGALPLLADDTGAVDVSVGGDGTARAVSRLTPRVAAGFLDADLLATNGRAAAMRGLDARLEQQLQVGDSQTLTVVAGISDDGTGPAQAHVLAISGPGWGHSGITSGTTHHTGWAQLVDIAPTLLAAAHLSVPPSMSGKPIRPSGSAPSVPSLVDDNEHARGAATAKFWTVSGICVAGGVALLLLLARRRRLGGVLAGIAAAAPVVTYLGQLAPWWRWPLLLDAALLLVVSAAIALAVTRLARRSMLAAAVVVPAVSAAVLAADQLAGAPLQLAAPLGDNPLVAGRFHGMGNIAFAVFAASAVLCIAAAAARAGSLFRGRVAAVATAVVLGLAAMVIDGAPMLGDDFGGLLALTVAVVVLGVIVSGARVTWWRGALAVVAAVAVAALVALADYARPASAQTHLGRFVGDLLHGRSDVVSRKAELALHSFGNSAVTGLVVLVVVVAIVGREQLRTAMRRTPALAAGLVAVGVVGVVGSVVNDSGVVVAAMVAVAGVLPPVAAWAATASGEYWAGDGRSR